MKFFKNIWKIAGAAILLGLVLIILGLIMGASRHIYADNTGIHVVDTKGSAEIKDLNLKKFTDIDIDVDIYSIEFIESDNYGIEIFYHEVKNKPDYSLVGEKLKISETFKNGWMFFNVDFNFISHNDQFIKIYLPKNAILNDVVIKSDIGSVNIGKFTSKSVNIKNNIGNVSINDAKIDEFEAALDTGILTLENCEILKGKIKSGIGSVKGTLIKSSNLKITCATGSIDLKGDFQGNTELSNNIGSIKLETSRNRDFYDYDISTDIGSITLDGEKQKRIVNNSNRNSDDKLTVTTDTGSIKINFNVD